MKLIRRSLPAIFLSIAAFGQTAPARPAFEVASIKPSPPLTASSQVNIGVHVDGAQITCNSFSLSDYIRIAYKVKIHQISGPDWIASERFDIAAKLPPGGAREQVPEMLQSLLEERFHLKLHHDSKEFPVYALVVAKGGLKMKESPLETEADTAEAGKGAVNVTATGGRGGTFVNLGRGSSFNFGDNRFVGKKLTMVTLADSLSRFMDRPVVDRTELKGNYDLTLEFSPEEYRAMMIRSAIAAGVNLPPEALRALEGGSDGSLFAALQTLGLKLEPGKAPIEILVIDRADKTPTEN